MKGKERAKFIEMEEKMNNYLSKNPAKGENLPIV